MKKNNGGKPQGENKYIRSDRSAKETAFKNIEIIPLQSCSLLINNTHTRRLANVQTHNKSSGRSYDNYYFDIVDDRLENCLKTL